MINYTAGPRSLNAMIHIYDGLIYGFKTVFNQNRAVEKYFRNHLRPIRRLYNGEYLQSKNAK